VNTKANANERKKRKKIERERIRIFFNLHFQNQTSAKKDKIREKAKKPSNLKHENKIQYIE
jgi:hypothetical protein